MIKASDLEFLECFSAYLILYKSLRVIFDIFTIIYFFQVKIAFNVAPFIASKD